MRRLVVAVVAMVLVPLVGCSEKDVRSEPSPTASASESVAPKEETAEEFIRRWFGTQQGLYDTGDATEYLSMAPECIDCKNAAQRVIDIYAAGGSVQYAGDTVRAIELLDGKDQLYRVTLDVGPTVFRERRGGEEKRLKGGQESYSVHLVRSGGEWLVSSILRTAS